MVWLSFQKSWVGIQKIDAYFCASCLSKLQMMICLAKTSFRGYYVCSLRSHRFNFLCSYKLLIIVIIMWNMHKHTHTSTHSKYQQLFATTTIFGRKMCVRWNVVFAISYLYMCGYQCLAVSVMYILWESR